MDTMQRRLLERIERDVTARPVPPEASAPASPWMTFDTTVASNVGLIQVGRYPDVGPRRQVLADFQAGRATFRSATSRPDIPREEGSGLGATSVVLLDYSTPVDIQETQYRRLIDYLTAPLRDIVAAG